MKILHILCLVLIMIACGNQNNESDSIFGYRSRSNILEQYWEKALQDDELREMHEAQEALAERYESAIQELNAKIRDYGAYYNQAQTLALEIQDSIVYQSVNETVRRNSSALQAKIQQFTFDKAQIQNRQNDLANQLIANKILVTLKMLNTSIEKDQLTLQEKNNLLSAYDDAIASVKSYNDLINLE